MGVGGVFIYLCSARQISFQIEKLEFELIWKETSRAEHAYMSIALPPQLTF